MICKKCGKIFDDEKYFKICPKCGTYNRPDEAYDVEQYYSGYSDGFNPEYESYEQDAESSYEAKKHHEEMHKKYDGMSGKSAHTHFESDGDKSHQEMHRQFDDMSGEEAHTYYYSSDGDKSHQEMHSKYDGMSEEKAHTHKSAAEIEADMMFGHMSKSDRQRAEKEAFERKEKEALERSKQMEKEASLYEDSTVLSEENASAYDEEEQSFATEETSYNYGDDKFDATSYENADESKAYTTGTIAKKSFFKRHPVGCICAIIWAICIIGMAIVFLAEEETAKSKNSNIFFETVYAEPGTLCDLYDCQITVFGAKEIDTSSITGLPKNEKLIAVYMEVKSEDRFSSQKSNVYIKYNDKYKEYITDYDIKNVLPMLGLNDEDVLTDYSFLSSYRYENGPRYFLFFVDTDADTFDIYFEELDEDYSKCSIQKKIVYSISLDD